MSRMKSIKYGWFSAKTKKIITPNDSEFDEPYFFYNNCRVLQPDEVWKYKIGTCWDQSLLIYNELIKLKYPCSLVFLQLEKDFDSHAVTFYKENNKIFRFEHSWEEYRGISGPYASIELGISELKKQILKNKKLQKIFINKNVNADRLLGDYNLTCSKYLSIVRDL